MVGGSIIRMIGSTICSRRRAVGALAIGFPAAFAMRSQAPGVAAKVATVIYVRHAEKERGEGVSRDPSLTQEGVQRARMLARTLQALGVTRVFSTRFKRTQQTASLVADALGLDVEEYAARTPEDHTNTLAALDPSTVALVVGHSNTVPAMVEALGGELIDLDRRGHLHETEYDRVIIQILFAADEAAPMRAIQTLDLRLEM